MGFWGTMLVACAEQPLTELAGVRELEGHAVWHGRGAGGWQVVQLHRPPVDWRVPMTGSDGGFTWTLRETFRALFNQRAARAGLRRRIGGIGAGPEHAAIPDRHKDWVSHTAAAADIAPTRLHTASILLETNDSQAAACDPAFAARCLGFGGYLR